MIILGVGLTILGLFLAGSGAWLLVRLEFRSQSTLLGYHAGGEGKQHFDKSMKDYSRATQWAVRKGIKWFASTDSMDMNAPSAVEAFSHRFWGTLLMLTGTSLQVIGAYLAFSG